MATKKYVSLEKLGLYDEKIKKVISDGDAAALADAKSYADSLAVNYDPAGSSATALADAKSYADGKDAAIAAAQKAGDDAAAAAKAADDKAVAAQGEVDALEVYVGSFTASEGVDTVVKYIDAKTANIASDETVGALADRIAQAETDIDNIEKDYLKAADKTELNGLISTAQAAADAAQEHSEGVASDLASAVEALEGADAAQVERIAALEGTIVGLSGAMHFKGVKDAIPEDVSGYEQGDVIIVGNKEYVFNDGAFVEFGDASVNAEAITALTGRVSTAEAKISTLEGEMDDVQAAVATKAEQAALSEAIEALEGADAGQVERIAALEAKFGDGDGSVEELIAAAKQEAIDASAADATTKASAAESNAKSHADGLNTAMDTRVQALEAIDHDHSNKAELDLIASGDKAKWDAAAAKAHEHSNLSVLEGITAAKVSAWDAAEGNAKTYADDLNSAMDTRMIAVEAGLSSFVEASEAEINALFA